MQSIEELSKDLVKVACDKEATNLQKCVQVEQRISWFLDDIFKLLINIENTSMNKMDRAQRLIDLEAKYGIPKTHLIIKP